jgi:uncharacterized protein YjbJ (UPF0337 family)
VLFTKNRIAAGHGDGKEVALSFLDDAKKKVGGSAEAAKDFVADHADSVKDGITKAGDFVDEKSGGKLSAGVDKAQDAASNLVDKFKK